jgi:outer membrane protein
VSASLAMRWPAYIGGVVCGAIVLLAPSWALAQGATAAVQSFTLGQALDYAAQHYPAVRAAVEQVTASAAGVDVARAAYLPRVDSLWQWNRATANNIFGQVLPQSVIPAMSGPVLSTTSSGSVWGTAAGALFAWEPYDFGLRSAGVASAEAAVARARAGETLTRLDVEHAVAAAFLNLVAAQRAVAALGADVERRDQLARTVHTLVDNQLRAGAEASRADAEGAAARTRLIQARQGVAVAQATLTRVLGLNASRVSIDADALLESVPAGDLAAERPLSHPMVQVHHAAVDAAHAQQEILARTDRPRVYLQSSVFARGSGANPSGELDGGLDGLGLERANWAAGVQIVLPNLFDFASLRARKAAAAATERAEAALYSEAILTVASERDVAVAMLETARAVAVNTPLQLAAARQSEAQARARYDAGLTNLVEVADAQSLLVQAEVQDQLARVDIWRALLAEAAAHGSLSSFQMLLPAGGAR